MSTAQTAHSAWNEPPNYYDTPTKGHKVNRVMRLVAHGKLHLGSTDSSHQSPSLGHAAEAWFSCCIYGPVVNAIRRVASGKG